MSKNECPLTPGRIRARPPGPERMLAQQQRRWPHRERRNGQLSPMLAAGLWQKSYTARLL